MQSTGDAKGTDGFQYDVLPRMHTRTYVREGNSGQTRQCGISKAAMNFTNLMYAKK